MHKLSFQAPPKDEKVVIELPASKSLHNRALIIQSFEKGILIENESIARDCFLMKQAISAFEKGGEFINVQDAGTVLRFILPRLVVGNWQGIVDGSERMRKRPIQNLVEALISLGADIEYVNEEGSLPLRLKGFAYKGVNQLVFSKVESSQFISGLLMVAPFVEQGLEIAFPKSIGSKTYIDMTLQMMKHFGASFYSEEQGEMLKITVHQKAYEPKAYFIEPDWSAVGYFLHANHYAQANLSFRNLIWEHSLQGDAGIVQFFQKAHKAGGGVQEYDFAQMPDQAQTFVPFLVSIGKEAILSGLESLNKKESLRADNLQADLAHFGYDFFPAKNESRNMMNTHQSVYELKKKPEQMMQSHKETAFVLTTHHDHRVAMGMALLAALRPLLIDDISVVEKSFPTFWQELEKLGYSLEKV